MKDKIKRTNGWRKERRKPQDMLEVGNSDGRIGGKR